MFRNPDFPGHQRALDLASRSDYFAVTDCNGCGHAIAWTRSQRTGKRYPCEVQSKQTVDSDNYVGTDGDVLRAAPWVVHTRERCQANQDRRARDQEDQLRRLEEAASVDELLHEQESLIRIVDRARGVYYEPIP